MDGTDGRTEEEEARELFTLSVNMLVTRNQVKAGELLTFVNAAKNDFIQSHAL